MRKRKIKSIMYWVMAVFILYLFVILPWYASADAVFARENLRYISENAVKRNVTDGTKLDRFYRIKNPLPVMLFKMAEYCDGFSTFYVSQKILASKITDHDKRETADNNIRNDFEWLGQIDLRTDNEDVRKIYTSIQYDISIMNPEEDYSYSTYTEWLKEKPDYVAAAQSGYNNLMSEMRFSFMIFVLYMIPGIRYITSHIKSGLRTLKTLYFGATKKA